MSDSKIANALNVKLDEPEKLFIKRCEELTKQETGKRISKKNLIENIFSNINKLDDEELSAILKTDSRHSFFEKFYNLQTLLLDGEHAYSNKSWTRCVEVYEELLRNYGREKRLSSWIKYKLGFLYARIADGRRNEGLIRKFGGSPEGVKFNYTWTEEYSLSIACLEKGISYNNQVDEKRYKILSLYNCACANSIQAQYSFEQFLFEDQNSKYLEPKLDEYEETIKIIRTMPIMRKHDLYDHEQIIDSKKRQSSSNTSSDPKNGSNPENRYIELLAILCKEILTGAD